MNNLCVWTLLSINRHNGLVTCPLFSIADTWLRGELVCPAYRSTPVGLWLLWLWCKGYRDWQHYQLQCHWCWDLSNAWLLGTVISPAQMCHGCDQMGTAPASVDWISQEVCTGRRCLYPLFAFGSFDTMHDQVKRRPSHRCKYIP